MCQRGDWEDDGHQQEVQIRPCVWWWEGVLRSPHPLYRPAVPGETMRQSQSSGFTASISCLLKSESNVIEKSLNCRTDQVIVVLLVKISSLWVTLLSEMYVINQTYVSCDAVGSLSYWCGSEPTCHNQPAASSVRSVQIHRAHPIQPLHPQRPPRLHGCSPLAVCQLCGAGG